MEVRILGKSAHWAYAGEIFFNRGILNLAYIYLHMLPTTYNHSKLRKSTLIS